MPKDDWNTPPLPTTSPPTHICAQPAARRNPTPRVAQPGESARLLRLVLCLLAHTRACFQRCSVSAFVPRTGLLPDWLARVWDMDLGFFLVDGRSDLTNSVFPAVGGLARSPRRWEAAAVKPLTRRLLHMNVCLLSIRRLFRTFAQTRMGSSMQTHTAHSIPSPISPISLNLHSFITLKSHESNRWTLLETESLRPSVFDYFF